VRIGFGVLWLHSTKPIASLVEAGHRRLTMVPVTGEADDRGRYLNLKDLNR
jgi:hypothetical protein